MDNFNLNAMGVKEMDSKEMRKTNGGSFAIVAAAIAVGAWVGWGIANFVKDVLVNKEQFDMTKW